MNELLKKLNDLQSENFEFVSIAQVQNWIAEIKRENRLRRRKR